MTRSRGSSERLRKELLAEEREGLAEPGEPLKNLTSAKATINFAWRGRADRSDFLLGPGKLKGEHVNKWLDKTRHWIKSYALASRRTPKGERRTLFLYGVAGLLAGMVLASAMKAHYDAEDRAEAFKQEMLQRATPPPGQGEKRWLALEQLKLLLK